MRKILSVLLAVAVFASMMTLTAFAAESGSMAVTNAELTAGSSATITVSLTGNPGVMAYTVKPTVPEGFTIQMAKAGMDGIWTIGKNAQWDNAEDSTYTGAILTVTVTAGADVKPGTYTISFSAVGANYDEEDVNFGTCTATITIAKPVCNHVWDAGKITKAPTCTEAGVKTYTCTIADCGETKTEAVSATGHTFGEWKVTKAATCTEKGVETRECACGEKETRDIAATGHKFGDWKVTKAATCTEKGVETRECACGEKETREIAVVDHAMNTIAKDETHHWMTCDNCGHAGEKAEHDYDYNGICECGATKPVEEDPDLDDVPPTGDITPYIAMTIFTVLTLAAAAAFVLKRKVVK